MFVSPSILDSESLPSWKTMEIKRPGLHKKDGLFSHIRSIVLYPDFSDLMPRIGGFRILFKLDQMFLRMVTCCTIPLSCKIVAEQLSSIRHCMGPGKGIKDIMQVVQQPKARQQE